MPETEIQPWTGLKPRTTPQIWQPRELGKPLRFFQRDSAPGCAKLRTRKSQLRLGLLRVDAEIRARRFYFPIVLSYSQPWTWFPRCRRKSLWLVSKTRNLLSRKWSS